MLTCLLVDRCASVSSLKSVNSLNLIDYLCLRHFIVSFVEIDKSCFTVLCMTVCLLISILNFYKPADKPFWSILWEIQYHFGAELSNKLATTYIINQSIRKPQQQIDLVKKKFQGVQQLK